MNRRLITALLAAAIACWAPAVAQADTPYEFADWTDVSAGIAHGTFHGGLVSLSGTDVLAPPAGTVNGDEALWNRPDFTPPIPSSDAISFVGGPGGNAYELDFGAPQTNPVLDFGSLASTLTFTTAPQITRLSGDAQFSVSDNQVIGAYEGPTDDGNGTVELHGTFTSIPFTANFAVTDGIYLQVGVPLPPDTTITAGPGGPIWNRITQFAFTATQDGSTFECSLDGSAFAACTSPYVTQSLSSGPHQFSVRAVSSDGVPDPTPATRDFQVNQAQDVTVPSCVVDPVLLWVFDSRSSVFGGPRSVDTDQYACLIERRTGLCPEGHVCRWITDQCPVGAKCRVTTSVSWLDDDSNFNHGALAAAGFGAPSGGQTREVVWGPYGSDVEGSNYPDTHCSTHGTHHCTASIFQDAIGPDVPWGACGWTIGGYPPAPSLGVVELGPDEGRVLDCTVSMHIEPADAYAPVQEVGQYVTVYMPTSGTLTYRPLPIPGFAAAKRQRPAIAPATMTISQPGKVRVKLHLNKAAQRILARRHSLPIALNMTFTPTSGPVVTNTTHLKLRTSSHPPKCAVRNPGHRSPRRLKVCGRQLYRH